MTKYGTNARTEVLAGLTMFAAMAYIIPVNAAMLSQTGIPFGAVILATCIAAAAGTALMSLWANLPYGMAPGMGLNAFFTFTVVFALGFSWQQALAMVFLSGVVDLLVTATGVRKHIIASIPAALRTAMGVGIGLFIAYIGIKDAGLLSFTSDPGHNIDVGGGTIVADSATVPAMVPLSTVVLILAICAIALTVILYVLKVKGAILISIVAATVVGAVLTLTNVLQGSDRVTMNWSDYFSTLGGSFHDLGSVFGQSITSIPGLFSDPKKIVLVIATIFAFSMTGLFDELGTSLGLGRSSGLFTEQEIDDVAKTNSFKTRFAKSLVPPSIATMFGSLFGTSNTTTYVESSTGIGAGGRTGVTSLTTACLFLVSIVLAPLAESVPGWATAPALIVVGVLMMSRIGDIDWHDIDMLEETIPAFLTIVIMPFAYSITTGIAVGTIVYCLIKLCRGKIKQIHPVLAIVALLFVAYFVNTALNG